MDETSYVFTAQTSASDALAYWREMPDASVTVAFCNWLAGHGAEPANLARFSRNALIAIGRESIRRHPNRVGVLVAVGRLFLAASELSLAVEVLVGAATLGPREPVVFRVLGEVLFRRGDVERAQRMFERAVSEGLTDPDTLAWLDRARLCAGPSSAPHSPRSAPPTPPVRTRSGVRLAAATHWTEPDAVFKRTAR